MLQAITRAAGRHDVLDRVGSASGKWNPVVRLQDRAASAVCAPVVIETLEVEPLPERELAFRSGEARPTPLVNHLPQLRMSHAVARSARGCRLRMRRVVQVTGGLMLVRMAPPPATHGLPRLVGIATHPLPPIGTALLRVPVRHRVLSSRVRLACQ